jgi:predicted lipoprotein
MHTFKQRLMYPMICMMFVTLAAALTGCSSIVTLRPLESSTNNAEGAKSAQGSSFRTSKGFDPVAYVDGLWDSKILPKATGGSTDLVALLSEIAQDKEAASQKYGRKESGPYNFAVKAEVLVDSVDTTSRAGTALLKPIGYTGPAEVKMQIGPVLRGTAIRDGSGEIPFNQFVNQIEYADVGEALNDRVLNNVLKGLDLAALKGKTLVVYGFFTLENPNKILITPVKIDVKS